jgi:cytosine deaminase
MLDVAHMGLHVAQMTGRDAMRACFEAVTTNAAAAIGLESYGIADGNAADFVVLDARDPIEAIRLRADRLFVIKRGVVIAETAPRQARLHVAGRPDHVRPADYAPTGA